MAIRQVNFPRQFITTDGEQFDNREDAERYEQRCQDIQKITRSLIPKKCDTCEFTNGKFALHILFDVDDVIVSTANNSDARVISVIHKIEIIDHQHKCHLNIKKVNL